MDCKSCKEARSGLARAEGEAMRQHKIIGWLIAVIVLLVVLLVGTNALWLHYEMQYEDKEISYEASTDSGGTAIANGEGSVILNGEGQSHNQNPNP